MMELDRIRQSQAEMYRSAFCKEHLQRLNVLEARQMIRLIGR